MKWSKEPYPKHLSSVLCVCNILVHLMWVMCMYDADVTLCYTGYRVSTIIPVKCVQGW